VYGFNFSFGKKSSDVAESLATRLSIDLISPPLTTPTSDETLEIEIEDEGEGVTYKPLIDAFDDPARREEITEELLSVIESIKAAEQDEKRGQAALKAIRDANTKLMETDIATADADTYAGMMAQLESVIKRALALKQELEVLGVKSKSPTTE
jgi:hypothetical protein